MSGSLTNLNDYVEVVMGQAPPGDECNKNGDGTVFVKAGEFQARTPVAREWTTKPLKMAQPNDSLVCVVGATAGKVNLASFDCAIGRSVAAVRPKHNKIDPLFLYQFLQTRVEQLRDRSQGAAQGVITREMLLGLSLAVPPLTEQRRIAAILDQAETLRTQRRTALALLDSLTQSLFLDMFGDPVANPKGFKTCLLGDIIDFVGGSQPAKEHFSFEPSPDSVRLVQIRDFRTDEFKTYIPRKLAKRFFEIEDVMIGRYGPPVFQIFRGLSGSYNVALMKALPKAGVLRDFIFFLLQEPGLHGYVVDRSTRTAGQSGVNLELLENYPAFIPPLPLQQTFATRIAAIDALKATHRHALAALDALFASLQQRAFAGAL